MTKFLIFFLLFSSLSAYSFGKNKVQYKKFEWKILDTEHFQIYYYPGGEEIAEFSAYILEEAYNEYSEILAIRFEKRIPCILYNAHHDFQQTNVTLELIEESVGGFTESFKNRVVVPFTGSYRDLRHVLRHELVHVFEFKMFLPNLRSLVSLSPMFKIPLWIMEGLAEYLSLGWDVSAETFMRDVVYNEKVIPVYELEYYGGYTVYKEGQAIFYFIEERYGKERVIAFIQKLKMQRSLEGAFRSTFGVSVEEFDEQFRFYLKERYFPIMEEFTLPKKLRRITNHSKDGGFMNVAPTLSPSGGEVAFVSDRRGFTDIYLASVTDGRIIRKLVSGERTPSLENLHLFRPGLSFSPDGRYLAFSAQGTNYDFIHIVNVKKGGIERSYPIELDAVYTPAWSPKGDIIAFVGVNNGYSDLYLLSLSSGEIRRITSGRFTHLFPSFSPDGERILFISDERKEENLYGSYAVFQYIIETAGASRLTPYIGDISYPFWIDQNSVGFVGEYRGSSNIMMYDTRKDSLYLLTDYITALRQPDFDIQKSRVVFSLLWNGGWDVYIARNITSDKRPIPLEEFPPFSYDTTTFLAGVEYRYTPSFSVDWLAGALEYSPDFGTYGAITVGLSDALGDHRIWFSSNLFQDITNSDFELDYLYLPRRIDYGFSIYQYWLVSAYYYASDVLVLERRLGVEGKMAYPFDKFKRIELGIGYERPTWYYYFYDSLSNSYFFTGNSDAFDVFSIYSGFVYDDVLYSFATPIDGMRFFVGGESTFLSDLDYYLLLGDLRKYFRITPRTTWAFRFIGGYSDGADPPYFWLGGPYYLRGYDYYDFYGTRLVIFNTELRVPFVDHLKLAFPLPIELTGIRGVLFFDTGYAWSEDIRFQAFERGGLYYKFKDLKGGVGIGLRLGLGYFNLKFDIAKRTDLRTTSSNTYYYLYLGEEF